jgi:hypothetical protein
MKISVRRRRVRWKRIPPAAALRAAVAWDMGVSAEEDIIGGSDRGLQQR